MAHVLIVILPYVLSAVLGYLVIDRIDRPRPRITLGVRLFLAGGIGMGLNAQMLFFTLICFHRLLPFAVIGLHLLAVAALAVWKFSSPAERPSRPVVPSWKTVAAAVLFLWSFSLLWPQARHFPFGGWDAWEVWNFKARFILLAGEHWTNIFQPLLWRSSPHYPLLLPLVNVWAWIFQPRPDFQLIPQITALLFTFLTTGLLLAALLKETQRPVVIAAPVLLLTTTFFGTIATSQYADIVMAYFLLAAIYAVREGIKSYEKRFFGLAGMSLGCLAFTKPEGMIAALLLLVLTGGYILFIKNRQRQTGILVGLMGTVLVCSLATVLQQLVYSPGNQTFINGLASTDHPSTLYRLKWSLAFLLVELQAPRWDWMWFLFGAGIVLGGRACWRRENLLIPLFLAGYLGVVMTYYWINTYFSIGWWLQVSLNRILFSLLPTAAFWVFASTAALNTPTSDAQS